MCSACTRQLTTSCKRQLRRAPSTSTTSTRWFRYRLRYPTATSTFYSQRTSVPCKKQACRARRRETHRSLAPRLVMTTRTPSLCASPSASMVCALQCVCVVWRGAAEWCAVHTVCCHMHLPSRQRAVLHACMHAFDHDANLLVALTCVAHARATVHGAPRCSLTHIYVHVHRQRQRNRARERSSTAGCESPLFRSGVPPAAVWRVPAAAPIFCGVAP